MGSGADGRVLLLLVLATFFGALWYWNRTQGWERAWQHLRIPALADFVDTRAVLRANDRFRAGEPMNQVSPDPNLVMPNSMTYPRTWLVFSYLGLTEASVYPVALALIAGCYGFSLLYMGRLSWGQAMLCLPVLISPALLLGVERGNVDLLMYLMVLGACWLFGRRAVTGACAVLLGAGLLKLYPVAGMLPAVRYSKGWIKAAVCAALFLVFCYAQREDLAWVMRHTPRNVVWSFGAFVPTDRLHLSHMAGAAASIVMAAAALVAARRSREWALPHDLRAVGFVAASSILALCYLIGNNYAYRFWFALLLLPQLMRWVMEDEGQARWAAWMLLGLVFTTSVTCVSKLWVLGVTLNWLLFGGVVYGLASALHPAAFRRPVRIAHDR